MSSVPPQKPFKEARQKRKVPRVLCNGGRQEIRDDNEIGIERFSIITSKGFDEAVESIRMTKDEVLKIHTDRFLGALTGQNYAALEALYSDDYILVRPDGSVLNKQEVLQDLHSNGLRFHSIDPRQLVARVYGSAGVVTGESRTVTSLNGVESRAHFRFIAFYLRVGDSIRLVHFQSTTLAR